MDTRHQRPRRTLIGGTAEHRGQNAHPWRGFIVLAAAIFLTTLDLFVVNVALPAVGADFSDASLASLSWILTGYAIVFAAVLVPAGKAGDLYGRRRLFSIGLFLFIAGSVIGAVAGSVDGLIAARVVQAVGAAAVTPNSLGLALTLFPPRRRPSVIAAWGAVAGLGAAAGPLAGAVLADADWRWIFLINLPVGAAALALVPRLVGEVRDASVDRLPDMIGAAALATAAGLIVLALSQGPAWGWDTRFVGSLVGAAVLIVAFVRRSVRHPAPIVELPMLRVRSFAHAMAATVFLWAAFAALLVSGALFLSRTWGFSVLETGLALAPGPAASSLFAALSGRLGTRFSPTRVGAVGAGMFAVGGVLMAALLSEQIEYVVAFLPSQILTGAGAGLTLPSLVAIALAELPASRLSTGTAVYTMFRQMGTALGVAVWVATLGTSSLAAASSYETGWVLIFSMAAASSLAIATSPRREVMRDGNAAAFPEDDDSPSAVESFSRTQGDDLDDLAEHA
jgi:EmrB/QacA subfamily drug resistance transporter